MFEKMFGFWCILVTASVCPLGAQELTSPAENLLRNGSLEQPGIWGSSVYTPGARTQQRASDGKWSGVIAAKGEAKNYAFTQEIPSRKLQKKNLKLTASVDIYIESWNRGVVFPLYMIVTTKTADGKFKSNYPASLALKHSTPRGKWVTLSHEFDLSTYQNIVRAEFMILGWQYKTTYFDGKIYCDNFKLFIK